MQIVRSGRATDYDTELALGLIPGASPINKYGRNTNVDATPTDIWDLPTQPIWLPPTQARIHAIVSSSVEDSGPGGAVAEGTGAKTLRVYGLKTWASAETSEDIVLDGTTAVNTSESYVIIHRMRALTWGAHISGPNVGIIKATAATDATITAQILAGAGQTQMAIYGVPSTHTLIVHEASATLLKATAAANKTDLALLANTQPDVVGLRYIVKHTWGLDTTGNSALPIHFSPHKIIPGPAIVKIQAIGSAADQDVSAWFNGEVRLNR